MQNNYLSSLDNLTRTDPTVIAASQATSGSARRYGASRVKIHHLFIVYQQSFEQFERF